MAKQDFMFVHSRVRTIAQSLDLNDLSKALTAGQLLAAGGHDLSDGNADAIVPPGGKAAFFMNPGSEDLIVVTVDRYSPGRVHLQRQRSSSSSSGRRTLTTTGSDSTSFYGWRYETTWTDLADGNFRFGVRAIPVGSSP